MVKSLLNPSINYPEVRKLNEDDKNQDASIYEANIYDIDVIIALGSENYSFINNNILYFPVYLVINDVVTAQIGIYEINSNKHSSILDEDGDIDINELGPLLLYSFVDKELISVDSNKTEAEAEAQADAQADADVDQDAEPSVDQDAEPSTDQDADADVAPLYSPLLDQGATQSINERKAYKNVSSNSWIQKFMSNNNFGLIDNEGAGDCLFATIRDGLLKIGKKLSVEEMREMLAKEANEQLFQGYKTNYEMALSEVTATKIELKDLIKTHSNLKARLKMTKDRTEQMDIIKAAENISEQHKSLKYQLKYASDLLSEFRFMKGINNLDDFKSIIKTCEFWGETWSISTLERILNIKLILFSEENYIAKDKDNVLICGQLNDTVLQEIGVFNPDYYIMVDFMGAHYKLITYKDRGALIFKELPYDVKKLVTDKCLERLAGPYSLIPDFVEFMNQQNIRVPINDPPIELQSDTYKGDTVFQFYSNSSDKPLPGKGAGETLGPEGSREYVELANIPEWRKKLSNFWVQPFELDGHKWSSVEHYYQASKFKENNPDFYLKFTIDKNTNSELSTNPIIAKAAGGRTGKYKTKMIRDKEITIDPNFYSGNHEKYMEDAMRAKFSQNADLKKVLLATKSAKLQHFTRGNPPVIFDNLMRVRKELRAANIV